MIRVLLVEPDLALSRIYKSALRGVGYGVDIAAGAQQAITLADRNTPNLIVLEIQLVSHNGIEFLYELRSYTEWQSIPILLHTIVPPGEFIQNVSLWKELGIKDYLYKPRTSLSQLLYSVSNNVPQLTSY